MTTEKKSEDNLQLVEPSNIWEALAAAVQQLGTVPKDAMGQYGKHASLEGVVDHTKPVLARWGLFVTQPTGIVNGQNVLFTRVHHVASGEVIESSLLLITDKPGSQGLGGAITYFRRYCLLSLLGLPTGDDPDSVPSSYTPPPYRQQHESRAPQQASGFTTPGAVISGGIRILPTGGLGDWVIPFGKYAKGGARTRIRDVPFSELQNYAAWLKKNADDSGKILQGPAAEFVDIVAQLEHQSGGDFAPNDGIPF